ncbi:MAG: hypothetical protein JXB00_11070 [Bacteroidales bacterium]|nr:hypothetical protein [Bacteroidales bacterium]
MKIHYHMKWFVKIIFISIFIYLNSFSVVSGQFFSSGNEPFGVKWRYFETDHLKMIFPTSAEYEANSFASLVELNFVYLNNSMNAKSSKINIIFHNQSVISNGFVTWAPKRMEIVTTPSREYHSQDWIQGLAFHEYRHVLQVNKLNSGFSKILTLLGGQAAIGIPVMQVPLWVNEGDAVITEGFTGVGRGSLPSFEMPFRSYLSDSCKKPSYDKLYFGSYKHFVPDYYKLGFYMTGFARIKYGNDVWEKALNQVGKNPLRPWALNHFFKKTYHSGLNDLYIGTIDTLKSIWKKTETGFATIEYEKIKTKENRYYTSYRFPHVYKNGSVIALKSSIDNIPEIVKIDNKGNEQVLHVPGILYEERLSCGDERIVWDEIIYDLRWEQRNYSVIKSLDLKNRKAKTLTRKTRYFSPCLSPDNQQIAVIETDPANNSSLVIISAVNGSELLKIAGPAKGHMNFPVWYDNHSIIVVFTTVHTGKMFYIIDIRTNDWKKLTQPGIENISQLTVWKNYLLYSAGYSGIDNIYALNLSDNRIFQITSSKFGAFDPYTQLNSDTLWFSEYTSNGYKPVKIKLMPEAWNSISDIQYFKTGWATTIAEKESGGFQKSNFKDTSYLSKPYSRIGNLFHIHTWAPFYTDPDPGNVSDVKVYPGIMLLSQNLLNTSISSFGLCYENKYLKFKPKLTFSGFYPVIDISATIGGLNKMHELPKDVIPVDSVYTYKAISAGSYIPFRFYNNKYLKFLMPEIRTDYENTLYFNDHLRKGIFIIHYKLTFYRFLKQSRMDILPKWGQLIYLTYSHSPFQGNEYGHFLSTTITSYSPGLLKHHRIKLTGSQQYQNTSKYYFPFNRISLPRGYSFVTRAFYTESLSKISVDYAFPFAYPDFSINSIMFMKRIRTNLFSDFAYGKKISELKNDGWKPYKNSKYLSLGLEIISDVHLLRFFFPFSIGLRLSYIPEYRKLYPQLLFSIDTSVL